MLANPTNAGYASGSGSFTPGTATEISATASNYWRFTGWNDGSTNTPRTVTVPATNTTYTASFSRIPPQPVIATFTGPGGGGVSIGGHHGHSRVCGHRTNPRAGAADPLATGSNKCRARWGLQLPHPPGNKFSSFFQTARLLTI